MAAVAVVLALGVAAFIFLRPTRSGTSGAPRDPSAALSDEQKSYLAQLEISDPHLSAEQNFLGDTVTYLDLTVTNKGAKAVKRFDLRVEFLDVLSQVVLRETTRALTERVPPLKPGEARRLRVIFEHLPAEWNQSPPRMQVIFVQF